MGGSASGQVFLLRTSCVGGAQNNNKGHSAVHLEGHLSARVRLIAQGVVNGIESKGFPWFMS